MRWKRWLLGVVLIVAVIPAMMYFGSLDWSKSHAAFVDGLPIFDATADSRQYRIPARGMEFRARVAGMQSDRDGIILLHGFPESSVMWTPLLDALASAGYRVVAFDMRGYSPGARPGDVSDYVATELAADVVAIADAVGFERFHLVGHDWGSAVGWVTVIQYSDRIRSWTGMAIPHLAAFVDALATSPEQQQRSGYMDILQKPLVPEFLLTYSGQKRLKALLARLPAEQRNEYLAIQAEPGALTAALNYYRALDAGEAAASDIIDVVVTTPTLFIWGNKDGVIARSTVEAQRPFIGGPFRELELDAGHSMLNEAPEQVIEAILAHVKANRAEPSAADTHEAP